MRAIICTTADIEVARLYQASNSLLQVEARELSTARYLNSTQHPHNLINIETQYKLKRDALKCRQNCERLIEAPLMLQTAMSTLSLTSFRISPQLPLYCCDIHREDATRSQEPLQSLRLGQFSLNTTFCRTNPI